MAGLGNIDDVYKHYLVVIEENQQLKKLLKECRETIDDAWMYCGIATPDAEAILTKIDNAIGEKK